MWFSWISAGTLSSQVRHPIWGEYAASLMQQGVSRPKVRITLSQGVKLSDVNGKVPLHFQEATYLNKAPITYLFAVLSPWECHTCGI